MLLHQIEQNITGHGRINCVILYGTLAHRQHGLRR